ncbi:MULTISPECIES: hypothetical protein [unclassified Nodosilinea]|jgi:plasmid stabilization system protein ParE|uniref:hypothetical protein n=1 Tax=unclassified Nodosilinea TaxID=2628167 RepID=UPI000DB0EE72|nr:MULTISPECIES: hypothetical protein [unclassified Nodosilinea]MDF0367910.1 hypothetical protein [Nodosilinea sp. TSF1-S3]PZV00130.1 MAG: hypothetical protein DCF32_18135 [Leptolyngbya sp.]WOD40684.1 hypothetical protein RRF56_07740 [Nodosilinea sp. E11]HZG40686.1 hypothetical protein [Nodosilinea sp.]
MGKSRLSPRQRSYEADLINRLSDNHQLNQAQQRISGLSDKDRDLVSERLSGRTRGRLRQNY